MRGGGRLFVVAGALALGCLHSAASASAEDAVVSHHIDDSAAEVREYWTPARMRSAVPLELEAAHGKGGAVHAEAGGLGTLSHVDPASFEVPDPSAFPNRTHGKVFFDLGGARWVCSATAAVAGNESVVVTAGHCVYGVNGGPWATNWIFIPAYRDETLPYGGWVARELHADPAWVTGTDLNSDFAAVVVDRNAGRTLHNVVGAMPIGFNRARPASLTAYGYPAAPPFDGERLRACASPNLGDDTVGGENHVGTAGMSVACDMTQGSSGGGWIGQDGVLASVHSHHHPGEPDHMYGPYLDSSSQAVYEAAAAAVVPGPPADPPADAGPAHPETMIVGKRIKGRKATVRFEGVSAAAPLTFECRLDGKGWRSCASPVKYGRLKPGRHRVQVRAVDAAGVADPSPAGTTVKVKSGKRGRR